jgi:thiol:disulfide interchange protein
MKQIMFLIALAGMATTGFAQTEFKPLPFQQALSEARAGDKHVLVDCYTSWCAPCHKMTNEVFPLKTVGDYLNPRFVSVKYDIEKDEEGKRLARQHDVTLIPTFLIFRPDGSLLHKIVGAADAERFLRQVEESFDNDRAYGVLRE